MAEYDENEAVKYIRNYVGDAIPSDLSDDIIFEVLDLMFDFFEENDEFDEDDLTPIYDYVNCILRKSYKGNMPVDDDTIDKIIDGELAYEDSLDD